MAVKAIIPSVAEDDAQLVRRLGVAVAAVCTDLSSASQALILEQAAQRNKVLGMAGLVSTPEFAKDLPNLTRLNVPTLSICP